MIKSHLARRETPKVQSTVVDVLVCDSAIHRDSGCGVPNAMGSEPSSHKYPGFRQVVLGTPGKLLGSNSENPLPFRDGECQSLPVAYLANHAGQQGDRWRLQSPYLEHFSQAFARFFMRVGLPVQIPEYK
jgi:hypothetical protein